MADLTGQHLGNYEIVALLSRGGMAAVYRARQQSVGRDVAIKVISAQLAEIDEFVERFEREARTIASLSHAHIVKIFDYGQHGDVVYLVMELLEGGSLADLIAKGALPPEHASRLLDQMASALDYAHQHGIIHRDLKPQNVLLDGNGYVFLTDFGIAKIADETRALTRTGTVMGTPAYMAPEQWSGLPVDARSDIYSLGIILFEMLTGTVPFLGDTPFRMMYMHLHEPLPSLRKLRSTLPTALDQVIEIAVAKDREQRFSSAGEFAAAFKASLSGTVSPSGRQSPPRDPQATMPEIFIPPPTLVGDEHPGPFSRLPRTALLGIGVFATVIVLIGILAVALQRSSGSTSTAAETTITFPATAVTPAATLIPSSATAMPSTANVLPSQSIAIQSTKSPIPPKDTPVSPTHILIPTETSISTLRVALQSTSASIPPTATAVPPTKTPIPPTATSVPPTATAVPPTKTPVPPTATAVPATRTPIPPTATSVPPTATAVPPTRTPVPPTATSVPPTATAVPPTRTPIPSTATAIPPTATTVPPTRTPVPPTVTPVPPSNTPLPPTNTALPVIPPGMLRTDSRGISQVWVPAGCFQMGSDPAVDKDAAEEEQPQHEACITRGFWLDQFLVTNEAYNEFVKDGGYTKKDYWSDAGWSWLQTKKIKGPQNFSKFGDPKQPRVGVSWYEADAYARWRAGRLPTEAEWEYAARGPNSLIYPWGNAWDKTRANVQSKGVSPVDAFTGGKSWVGSYDMAGNVWQWEADWYLDTYYQQKAKADPPGPTSGDLRVLRGGAWDYTQTYARSANRYELAPDSRGFDIGFRVATSAP